jgi:hypothetical protein
LIIFVEKQARFSSKGKSGDGEGPELTEGDLGRIADFHRGGTAEERCGVWER